MSLSSRQLWFLRAMAALGALLIVLGVWEFHVAGAIHAPVCGFTILLLVLAARRIWARPGA